jgi:hypothetical protein
VLNPERANQRFRQDSRARGVSETTKVAGLSDARSEPVAERRVVQMVKEVVLDERPPAGKVAAAVNSSRIVTSGGLFSAPRMKLRLVHLPGEHVSDYPRGSAFFHGAAVRHAVPFRNTPVH